MYPRGEGFVLISLGDLYRDLRSYNEAHQAYQMAQSVAEATHDNSCIFILQYLRRLYIESRRNLMKLLNN